MAIAFAVALGVAAVVTCLPRQPTLAEACQAATRDAPPDQAALCLASFAITGDAASGARAGRALESQDGAQDLIERIAAVIGDSDAGADAWLAAGNVRRRQDPARAALAYQRALDHRAADNVSGRLHDTIGLFLAFSDRGDYENATLHAAAAYELVPYAASDRDRGVALLDIAQLLFEIGNLDTTARVMGEAEQVVDPTSSAYPYLQQLRGFVEQRRGHPALARQALTGARRGALGRHNDELSWYIYTNLLDLALERGDLKEARALLAASPAVPNTPTDRAAHAYYQAWFLVLDGKPRDAVRVAGEQLRHDPTVWVRRLETIHGAALRRSGEPELAEQALLRAIRAVEEQRARIDNDTLKSWLMAQQRAPFEELFLLYIEQGRLRDALGVVQRATARSVLDRLLEHRPPSGAMRTEIIGAGARVTALKAVSHSLHASPGSAAPPIEDVLARLRGRHVVTYFRANRDLWALAITHDTELVARRIGDAGEVARLISRWFAQPDSTALAAQLGDQLLPDPLVPPAGETLFVVLDDALGDVTFASLRRHDVYLVERNPVAYGLSATSLSLEHEPPSTTSAVVLGDPTSDLPDARDEAVDVAQALDVIPYLGVAATRAVVLAAANANVLHIAAHTDSSARGPEIHLATASVDAATILEYAIAPPLVVLLGCSSARIADRDALGALASAFIAAGAGTVVASRWTVDDAFAHRFARVFYAEHGAHDPIAALAAAQRRLLYEGVPAGQWATFVVVGGLRIKP